MALASFEPSLARLLKDEGGYTNHPSDPGGPTNFGITLADARLYWKRDATADDVRRMDIGVARSIYRVRYWDAQRCSELPAGIDYTVFDYGVNSGVGRAGKVLRRCLGLSDTTWIVTPEVVAAAQKADATRLCAMIWSERLAFLRSLKTWPVFGKGWGNRVSGGRAFSQALIFQAKDKGGTPVRTLAHEPLANAPTPAGKGQVPLNTTAQGTSTGAVVIAGTTTAEAGAQAGLSPWLIVLIAAFTLFLSIGALVYFAWWQKQQQEAPVSFTTPEEADAQG